MGGKPMKIPSPEVLAGVNDVPPAAVSGGAGECQEERLADSGISDRELMEKIERMKSMTLSFTSKLPDKGAKLVTRLRELEEEQERRKKAVQSEDDKDALYDKGTKSKRAGNIDSGQSFISPISSESGLQQIISLNHRMQEEAETGFCTIASEKMPHAAQNIKSLKQNEAGYSKEENSLRAPLRSTSCLSGFACSKKRKSTEHYYKDGGSLSKETPNNNSSSISKRTRTCKSTEPHELDWIKTMNVVLLDDEDVLPVQHANERPEGGELKEAKIYYPSRDHPEVVEVCFADVKCLDPQSYLSSTIMNFYIQYLQSPASIVGRPINEYHFFNTYFYQKLEKAISCKADKIADFSKLRRWLRGVNIFQKAYIFLPIHGDLHWSLVIICIPTMEDKSGPIILHLDSLGYHCSNAIFGNIETYLKEEWRHVYTSTSPLDIPVSKEIWDTFSLRIKKKRIMVPQQKNEYDCGLFVLYFMERFIEETPQKIKRKDLAKFGSKWFQPEEASGLRKSIRQILLHEFKKIKLENHNEKSP